MGWGGAAPCAGQEIVHGPGDFFLAAFPADQAGDEVGGLFPQILGPGVADQVPVLEVEGHPRTVVAVLLDRVVVQPHPAGS
ncbi:hypothetical protein BC342_00025 [Streptomyces olivaceus]|nr:hypothetical protein BC342_00025 [Streptomyces olivaceus]